MKRVGIFFFVTVACAAPQTSPTRVNESEVVLARARAVPGIARLLDKAIELRVDSDAIVAPGAILRPRLPRSAAGALHLEGQGGSADVRALDVADVPAAVAARTAIYADARPATDVIVRASRDDVEELRVVRERVPGPVGRYSLTLHGSFIDVAVVNGHLEIRDRDGVTRLATAVPFAIDAAGVRRDVSLSLSRDELGVFVVETHFDFAGLRFPVVIDPVWQSLAPPSVGRLAPGVAVVGDKVLLFGGLATGFSLSTSLEIFDTRARTWKTGRPLAAAAFAPIVTALGDGKVLVAGGAAESGLLSSAALYDPATDTYSTAPAMTVPRAFAVTINLPSGEVLIGGGGDPFTGTGALSSTEIYSPSTNTWRAGPTMKSPRMWARAVALTSGKRLIVGGKASAEIFDPTSNTFTETTGGPVHLEVPAVRLPSGKVLAAGGADSFPDPDDVPRKAGKDAWLFDEATSTWTATTPLPIERGAHHAFVFGGRAMFVGGIDATAAFYSARVDVFDDSTATWLRGEELNRAHYMGGVVQLPGGTILAVTGQEVEAGPAPSAEIYGRALGEACDSAGSCLSGYCVDGVCCDTACTAQCEACDVAGVNGRCLPVDGPPHGTRTACAAGSGDVCAALACDGLADRTKCTAFKNGPTVACGAAKCENDSFIGPGACSGKGECTRPLPSRCTPYACAETGCRTSCTNDSECAATFFCDAGVCKPKDAVCSDDLLTSKPRLGGEVACAPYKCDAARGTCRSACDSSDQCAPGRTCDTASKTCVAPPAAPEDDGGCAVRRSSPSRGLAAAFLALAWFARRRRRARRHLKIERA